MKALNIISIFLIILLFSSSAFALTANELQSIKELPVPVDTISEFNLLTRNVDTFFTNLISTKAELDRGEMVFEFNNPFSIPFDASMLTNYYEQSKNLNVESSEMFLLKQKEVITPIYEQILINKTCEYTPYNLNENITPKGELIIEKETPKNITYDCSYYENGKLTENKISYVDEWQPIKEIPAGKSTIKIVYHWQIKLGERAVDIMPSLIIPKSYTDLKISTWEYKATKWTWFNTSWSYKKEINLSGVPANTTNYQQRLVITKETGMNSNYSDLRFTNPTETTSLPYWIETSNASQAIVWLNVSIFNGTVAYLYYGDTSAVSTSNGSNVFLFFDDFNRADSASLGSNWQNVSAGNWSIISNQGYRNHEGTACGSDFAVALVGGVPLNFTDIITQATFNFTVFSGTDVYFGLTSRFLNNCGTDEGYHLVVHNAITNIQLLDGGVAWKTALTTTQALNENWNYELQINGTTINGKLWKVGTTKPTSWTITNTTSSRADGFIGISGQKGPAYHANAYFDNFFARTWIISEPTATFGSEEYSYFTFVSQTPSDINATNAFGGVAIVYNISTAGLNLSSLKLLHKISNGSDECKIIINGSAYCGYSSEGVTTTNASNSYTFTLSDNQALPGFYNVNDSVMRATAHNAYALTGNNAWVKIATNDTNATIFKFGEIMANTSGANPLQVYYCNSTYSSGNPQSNANCAAIYSIGATSGYNHTHGANSAHNLFTATLNITSGKIGAVKISNPGYYLFYVGTPLTTWNLYYANITANANTTQTSGNNGNSWTSQAYSFDFHLHAFMPTDKLYYLVNVYDNASAEINNSVVTDNLDTTLLPPSAPGIYTPVSVYYANWVFINYSASLSPNGVAISAYNLSLLNNDYSLNATINASSTALTYNYSTSALSVGTYYIRVEAKDANNLTSAAYSLPFYVNNKNLTFAAFEFLNATALSSWSVNLSNGTNTTAYTGKSNNFTINRIDAPYGNLTIIYYKTGYASATFNLDNFYDINDTGAYLPVYIGTTPFTVSIPASNWRTLSIPINITSNMNYYNGTQLTYTYATSQGDTGLICSLCLNYTGNLALTKYAANTSIVVTGANAFYNYSNTTISNIYYSVYNISLVDENTNTPFNISSVTSATLKSYCTNSTITYDLKAANVTNIPAFNVMCDLLYLRTDVTYPSGTYYRNNYPLQNATNFTIYLANLNANTLVEQIISITDYASAYYLGHIIIRRIVGANTVDITSQALSGAYLASTYLTINQVYKVYINTATGASELYLGDITAAATTTSFIIGASVSGDTFASLTAYNLSKNIHTAISWNNSTRILYAEINDSNNFTTAIKITLQNLTITGTAVESYNTTDKYLNHSWNLSNRTGVYQVLLTGTIYTIGYSPHDYLLNSNIYTLFNNTPLSEANYAFLAFIIVGTLALLGFTISIPIGIVFTIVSIAFTSLFGILQVGAGAIVGLIIVGVIIIFVTSKRTN
jgi:hypothetical protein